MNGLLLDLQPAGEGNDIQDFTTYVKQLVHVKVDNPFLFQEIDEPVQYQLNDCQQAAAGYQPDPASVDQGVGGEAINPEASGGQVFVLRDVVSIFMECEELTLKWVIAQCMGNEQCQKNGQCCCYTAPGEGINVIGEWHWCPVK
ncbi:MAG: hypothetical protein MK183_01585 [Verrucomicrobiales bacterium]|nr:hypothetical protein [Verrucomicrobiales bacterium]